MSNGQLELEMRVRDFVVKETSVPQERQDEAVVAIIELLKSFVESNEGVLKLSALYSRVYSGDRVNID